jgi:hypothetical protein
VISLKLKAEFRNFSFLGSGRAIPARTERLSISFEVVSSVRSGGRYKSGHALACALRAFHFYRCCVVVIGEGVVN